jgi:hypothetical protein
LVEDGMYADIPNYGGGRLPAAILWEKEERSTRGCRIMAEALKMSSPEDDYETAC